jgi:hypothetical protein
MQLTTANNDDAGQYFSQHLLMIFLLHKASLTPAAQPFMDVQDVFI